MKIAFKLVLIAYIIAVIALNKSQARCDRKK